MAALTELIQALLALKAEVPRLPRDKTATVSTQKGSYSYSYTDLATIGELIDPLLTKHELIWTALPTTLPDGQAGLAYKLLHISGQCLEGVMPLPGLVETMQGFGSGVTYGRRYAKVAVLDLIADEDDDGQAAEAGYHRESRANGDGVDMREHAKGLSNDAINVARQTVGLPRLEKPWSSLLNIPEGKAQEFYDALNAARAAEG